MDDGVQSNLFPRKCDDLEARLAELRASAQQIFASQSKIETTAAPSKVSMPPTIGMEDVLHWAEEV